ncbi:hypothetical protein Csa_010667 [Cucumis sativus]|uniref:Uncharacterized protein n=1 Tax=Cucumis sativus TaxID=3659 RepID=A0A0A0LAS4_CUCSA|nr:hypothetical protein Csa_010667 [Cucumis sativus]
MKTMRRMDIPWSGFFSLQQIKVEEKRLCDFGANLTVKLPDEGDDYLSGCEEDLEFQNQRKKAINYEIVILSQLLSCTSLSNPNSSLFHNATPSNFPSIIHYFPPFSEPLWILLISKLLLSFITCSLLILVLCKTTFLFHFNMLISSVPKKPG